MSENTKPRTLSVAIRRLEAAERAVSKLMGELAEAREMQYLVATGWKIQRPLYLCIKLGGSICWYADPDLVVGFDSRPDAERVVWLLQRHATPPSGEVTIVERAEAVRVYALRREERRRNDDRRTSA